MTKIVLLVVLSIFVWGSGAAEETRYEADWDSIRAGYEYPAWFQDAKFGIFVIWGPHSVPATSSEKYSKRIYAPKFERFGTSPYKHHVEHYGGPEKFGYKDFFPMFRMENYDPAAWADLFKRAGARYVVPMGDYHDGYAMYDSQHTRWDAVETGPKKDVMQMLADAVRAEGLKFGISSHFALHRVYYPKTNPDWDTSDPEYADLYGEPVEPGSLPSQEFLDHWWDRTTDVIDRYEPDLMWFDFGLDKPGFESVHAPILAYYYNKGLDWDKEVVFQDKNMHNESFPEDLIVLDIERGRMSDINPRPWQTDTSIGIESWGYVTHERYKSPGYLIDELIDIVSKNGCLLLAVGPKADGTIAPEAVAIFEAIGEWLGQNGEAIYDTRPWRIFGEGPTQVSAGHHSEHENLDNVAADIRFTTKDDALYAMALAWPDDGVFTIRSLATGNPYEPRPVADVAFVSGKNSIEWAQTDKGLTIVASGGAPNEAAFAFRIKFR